jgi:hypothetical protein
MLPPCDTAVFGGRCIFLKIFGSFIYFSKIKVEKIYKKFSRSRAMEGVCPSSPPRRHSTPALGRHLAAGGPTLLRLGLQRRRSGATLLATRCSGCTYSGFGVDPPLNSLPESAPVPRARSSRHRPDCSRHNLCREGALGRVLPAPLGRQRPLCHEPRAKLSTQLCREPT